MDHPAYVSFLSRQPQSVKNFTARLNALGQGPDAGRLLAHAYVRYLGDLSGGQEIRRRIAKAYELEGSDGVRFYEFNNIDGAGVAKTPGDFRRIKLWYRDGMDAGARDDVKLKEALVEEASAAFNFTGGLLAELQAPGPAVSESTPAVLSKVASLGIFPSIVSLQGVLTIIAAACLGHFLLVIGGFTSSRFDAKLSALESWVNSRV